MTYRILYNPASGNGRGLTEAEKLRELYKGEKLDYVDILKVGDDAAFLRTFDPDDVIVLCGGDGTLNHFANDVDIDEVPNEVLFYGTGSGNDFMTDIGKKKGCDPFPIKDYLRDLPEVTVNGMTKKFINGIGYGIDGFCCEEGDRIRAKSDKKVNYTAIALKGLVWKFHPSTATVTIGENGETKTYHKVWLAPTMQGRYFGGGMMATPGQDRLDPEHYVTNMVGHNLTRVEVVSFFPMIFSGKHVKRTGFVAITKCHDVHVGFDRPCALQIDGETVLNVTEYSVATVKSKNHSKNKVLETV